uniref:Uncharacterized protein n=1 Tax=Rhizophora mucronata TaxID=61149 RepID=A0A2P2NIV5_RHIMU
MEICLFMQRNAAVYSVKSRCLLATLCKDTGVCSMLPL